MKKLLWALGAAALFWASDARADGYITIEETLVQDGSINTSADVLKRQWSIHIASSTLAAAISTGAQTFGFRVPYNMTVTAWEIVADQSGSIVVDLYCDTYGNWPPTSSDSITGSEKPTLSAAVTNTDTSLTSFTTSITAGQWCKVNVDSAGTVTWVDIAIIGRAN